MPGTRGLARLGAKIALMRTVSFLALILTGCSSIPTPASNAAMTATASELAALPFDGGPISTSGHVTAAVWPEGGIGMIVVQTGDGLKYAFSTAAVPEMAKQGLTRRSLGPGEEVGVLGVLAAGKTVGSERRSS